MRLPHAAHRRAVGIAVAATMLLAPAGAMAGFQPPNDDLFLNGGNAVEFSTQSFAATDTIFGATEEPMENDHAGITSFQGSLWWKWTAPSNKEVRLQSCHLTGFDSVLAVYEDDTNFPLDTEVVSNDDGCGAQSRLTLTPVEGETYLITLTRQPTLSDNGTYDWSLTPTPPNDDLADPTTLPVATPIFQTGDTRGGTEQPGENDHAGAGVDGGASAWYSWTPTADASVSASTCGDGGAFPIGDTVLAVYENGGTFPLTEIVSNDDACGQRSAVSFDAEANHTYLIAVDGGTDLDGLEAQEGTFRLDLATRPPNDDFADAQAISGGLPTGAMGTVVGATAEPPDEPAHGGPPAFASVWYSWTPPAAGDYAIDTCDSAFDTRLAVYTGATLGALTEVASNADACGTGGSRSRVSFHVNAPVDTHWIAVDSSDLQPGALDLDIAEADLTDPVATLDSATIKRKKGKATFNFSGADNVTAPAALDFTCRIDSKPAEACSSPKIYKRLKRGTHTFRVHATDEAGNTGPDVTKTFKSSRR